ncbi:FAD-binding protein [Raoultibacter timonensis]|uniref:FAD-binding protein n=1 Tax=Raoultibacter timonensis TaxID=1907662 RepID=UPI000C852659|nr:FAD-binding protein [Raoultibacter timonensis]
MEVTRRDLFKFGGLAAVGALGGSALAGCSPQAGSAEADDRAGGNEAQTPEFLKQPEAISEFAETKGYDVVVVGAGESGLAAVHTALEAGASVACVQNIGTAQTTGNMGASVDTTKTDAAGVEACVAFLLEKNAYRSNRKLLEAWAKNSYEAIAWWADTAAKGGADSKPYDSSKEYNGYTFYLHANTYNHLEGAHNDAALAIADQLAVDGAEFFYDSPAVQLCKEGERIVGVISETENGYTLFRASKGVILATGDCSGNEEMRNYYCPDLRGFKTMSTFRDGSGMCAGIWAGAQMTPINHSKMVHGGGALTRLQVPFLNLDIHGKRFMNEALSFAYLNNLMRDYLAEYNYQNSMAAKFFTIMPANWQSIAQQWAEENPSEVQLSVGNMKMPDESKFVMGSTYEELAANINAYMEQEDWGIDPIDEKDVVASIESYNALCATNADTEYGKRAKYLVPLEEGPYYAVPRGANSVPAVLGGLVVDENQQCLDFERKPIEGLFAVGNASGQFYGGVDYPMDIEGLSVGRAITSGYLTGRYVASL